MDKKEINEKNLEEILNKDIHISEELSLYNDAIGCTINHKIHKQLVDCLNLLKS